MSDDYATKSELAAAEGRLTATIQTEIGRLREAMVSRWEFWIAIVAIILTTFFGTWAASQTAAQTGFTAAQLIQDSADRTADQTVDRLKIELDRRDAEKQRQRR